MAATHDINAACAELLIAGERALRMLERTRSAAADRLTPDDIAAIAGAQARWRLASDAFVAATAPRQPQEQAA